MRPPLVNVDQLSAEVLQERIYMLLYCHICRKIALDLNIASFAPRITETKCFITIVASLTDANRFPSE